VGNWNKVYISEDVKKSLINDFLTKNFNIKSLTIKYSITRKPIIRILKENIDILTYENICQNNMRKARSIGSKKTAKEGKKIPKRTKEWCEKISQSNKGKKLSEDHRKIAIKNFIALSKEQITKRTESAIETKRNNRYFEEWSKMIDPFRSGGMKGKKHSEKSKLKMSNTRKIRIKDGRIKTRKGAKMSPETIKKMREITKKRWRDGKFDYGNGIFRSKLEKRIFAYIKEKYIDAKHSFRIKGETKIYDIYIPKINLIIEINGDYWHLNPKMYGSNYFDKSRNVTSDEIRKKDKQKIEIAEKHKYKTLTLWEFDLKNKQKEEILEIINDETCNLS
jgi:G:T-mismatch repair DNA endonuclease (very short patch repair protein)